MTTFYFHKHVVKNLKCCKTDTLLQLKSTRKSRDPG